MIKSEIFPTIYNKKNYLVSEIPNYHPDSAKYLSWWRTQKKRIFEGCWIPDTKEVTIDLFNELDYDDLVNKKHINHSWRWIPPGLYFYINFGTILHKPEDAPRTAPKQKIVPYLSDFEMAFTYNWVEARGFSGFEDDEEFTCNEDIILLKDNPKLTVHPTCYNKEGKLKKYIPARQYLRKLNDKPLGRHLYFNQARNLMLLGSRGGGKSWLSAIYVLLHEIITDGSKYYTEKALKDPPLNEIFLGSGIAAKSADLAAKIKIGMDNLPGIWKKGTPEQKPSPLFKHMAGTLAPNNIKNPWRHEYEKKIGGEYIKVGSGSNIKHGVFTTENPEATAGGRYSVIVIEEVGLTSNLLTVHGSSEATQMTDGTDKYGSSLYIGTGGNIDKIVEAEIIFRDPEGFNMLPFDDEWENAGKIGWFVPAYYMDRRYKDSEGNTLIEEAYKNYTDRRIQKKKAKSGSALDLEMMNYPLIPSEMFLNKTNNNYPTADLKHRLAELATSPKILNSTWKGEFTINSEGKVEWKTVDKLPIREFPVKSTNTNNIEGCPEMFYPPQRDENGDIASGRYIAACLLPGEKVITDKGLKPIESVIEGDKLINQDGIEVDIIKFIKLNVENEDSYEVKVANTLRTTTFTKEHPILTSKVTNGYVSYNKSKRLGINQRFKKFDFKYKPVSELTTDDWIKVPNIYKNLNNFDINTLWDSSSHRIDRQLKNPLSNKDFWWFIGLFLGDGWTQGKYKVSVSFNEKETQYIDKFTSIVSKLFNRAVSYKTGNGSTTATFCSMELVSFLDTHFGKYALGKKLPEWAKKISPELKLNLLLGYLNSDGCITLSKNKDYISTEFVSINLELLEGIQDILFSLGIISSITLLRKESKIKFKINNIESNTLKTYHLRISHRESLILINRFKTPDDLKIRKIDLEKVLITNTQKQTIGCFFSEDLSYIYFKVDSIKKSVYSGVVYNFECVTNTFMCHHITTHNCDPVDDDGNNDITTSLQSFFIFDTFYDRIVFEYTGRTRYAKDFYEQCRRALIYYNARMLYENQKKGVFTYFDQKNSTYLMEDTPEALRDIDMQKISKTGNKSKGVYATPAINKWGREDLAPSWMSQQALNKPEGVTNAMTLKSPALIREAILYNPNLNTDRISALGLLMIFREIKAKYTESSRRNQGIKTVDEDPFWSKNYGRKAIAN